ncbi:MAG: hypothetical protein ACWGON_03225 [Gemmatimonadota bacterium]
MGVPRIVRVPSIAAAVLLAMSVAPSGAIAQGVRGGADSVRVRLAGVSIVEAPGTKGDSVQIEIRVAIDHAIGFHSWPDEPVVPPELKGLNPIATSLEIVSLPDGVQLEGIEWPDPVTVTVRYTSEPLDLLSFADTVVARLRLRLPTTGIPDPAQVRKSPDDRIELAIRFQSCDEEYCYPPRREELSVPLVIDP